MNFIRPQLIRITVPGAVVPSPYSGKQRQIMVNMDQRLMQSKDLAPNDVLGALTAQSMVLPSGTAKIGQSEYDILNSISGTGSGTDISLVELGLITLSHGHAWVYGHRSLRSITLIYDKFTTFSGKYADPCGRGQITGHIFCKSSPHEWSCLSSRTTERRGW